MLRYKTLEKSFQQELISCLSKLHWVPSNIMPRNACDEQFSDDINPELANYIQREVESGFLINLIGWPILIAVAFYIAYRVNTVVIPYLFIDEIFHVDQTIQYINGYWKQWNGKITTPPGLYIFGWLQYKVLKLVTTWNTLQILRTVNLFGGLIVFPWVVLRPLFLFQALGFWPITLMCFPLLSTYYFLYYTDVWSTILIIEALSLAMTLPFGEKKSIWLSAICGLVSCFFRQTNIIWNGLILILVVERRAMIQKDFNNMNFNNYLKLVLHSVENFKHLVLPYMINFFLFFCFLLYNRSITLGDKLNHSAGLHVVQFFYCMMFITLFSFPLWASRDFAMSYKLRNRTKPFQFILELLGIMIIIRFFTVIHKFLLADNRHFTFYLFRKLINRNRFCKYLVMALIYHFSTFVYLEVLRPNIMFFHPIVPIKTKNPVDLPIQLSHISWTTLIIATFMSVVPSPLFEPRYYILPYFFWRLFVVTTNPITGKINNQESNNKRLLMELSWFILINAVVYFVFSTYSFSWDTESNLQRIIW